MKEKKLIFIKLGGSLITTRKPYTLDSKKINEITEEIRRLRKEMGFKLLIGNGAGSFAHVSAKKYNIGRGIFKKKDLIGQSIVGYDASRLNKIVVKELIDKGECAVSVQPSSSIITEAGKIKTFYLEPIKNYLKNDLVPVVHGDVVSDIKKGCAILSTEKLFNYLAKKLKPDRIIIMSNVEGVYDAEGKIIPEINGRNFKKIKKYLKGAAKVDVTGGMLHKVKEALEMAKNSAEVNIIGGGNGVLRKCLKGEMVGTKIIR